MTGGGAVTANQRSFQLQLDLAGYLIATEMHGDGATSEVHHCREPRPCSACRLAVDALIRLEWEHSPRKGTLSIA